MEEVSLAVAMPFMPLPDTQMELAGIMLGKSYCNGNTPLKIPRTAILDRRLHALFLNLGKFCPLGSILPTST